MPLLLILIVTFLSTIYIFDTVKDFNRRRISITSLAYLTFLGMILFTPLSFDGTSVYLMPSGTGSVNLHQLNIDLGFYENIILTIPLGFLFKRAFSKISVVSMIPLGLMTGAAIETLQYYLSHTFFINRTSDINDVIANGIGIVIGAGLMVVYQYVVNKRLFSKSI